MKRKVFLFRIAVFVFSFVFIVEETGSCLYLSGEMKKRFLPCFGVEVGKDRVDIFAVGERSAVLPFSISYLREIFRELIWISSRNLWVNLSPSISLSDVMDVSLTGTKVGKILGESDLLLKEKAVSLLRKYFSVEEISEVKNCNSDFRFWIEPDFVKISRNKNTFWIADMQLRVKVASGYKTTERNDSRIVNVLQEKIIPYLTREVNIGQSFLKLRILLEFVALTNYLKENVRDDYFFLNFVGFPESYSNFWVSNYLRDYLFLLADNKNLKFSSLFLTCGGVDFTSVPIKILDGVISVGEKFRLWTFKARLVGIGVISVLSIYYWLKILSFFPDSIRFVAESVRWEQIYLKYILGIVGAFMHSFGASLCLTEVFYGLMADAYLFLRKGKAKKENLKFPVFRESVRIGEVVIIFLGCVSLISFYFLSNILYVRPSPSLDFLTGSKFLYGLFDIVYNCVPSFMKRDLLSKFVVFHWKNDVWMIVGWLIRRIERYGDFFSLEFLCKMAKYDRRLGKAVDEMLSKMDFSELLAQWKFSDDREVLLFLLNPEVFPKASEKFGKLFAQFFVNSFVFSQEVQKWMEGLSEGDWELFMEDVTEVIKSYIENNPQVYKSFYQYLSSRCIEKRRWAIRLFFNVFTLGNEKEQIWKRLVDFFNKVDFSEEDEYKRWIDTLREAMLQGGYVPEEQLARLPGKVLLDIIKSADIKNVPYLLKCMSYAPQDGYTLTGDQLDVVGIARQKILSEVDIILENFKEEGGLNGDIEWLLKMISFLHLTFLDKWKDDGLFFWRDLMEKVANVVGERMEEGKPMDNDVWKLFILHCKAAYKDSRWPDVNWEDIEGKWRLFSDTETLKKISSQEVKKLLEDDSLPLHYRAMFVLNQTRVHKKDTMDFTPIRILLKELDESGGKDILTSQEFSELVYVFSSGLENDTISLMVLEFELMGKPEFIHKDKIERFMENVKSGLCWKMLNIEDVEKEGMWESVLRVHPRAFYIISREELRKVIWDIATGRFYNNLPKEYLFFVAKTQLLFSDWMKYLDDFLHNKRGLKDLIDFREKIKNSVLLTGMTSPYEWGLWKQFVKQNPIFLYIADISPDKVGEYLDVLEDSLFKELFSDKSWAVRHTACLWALDEMEKGLSLEDAIRFAYKKWEDVKDLVVFGGAGNGKVLAFLGEPFGGLEPVKQKDQLRAIFSELGYLPTVYLKGEKDCPKSLEDLVKVFNKFGPSEDETVIVVDGHGLQQKIQVAGIVVDYKFFADMLWKWACEKKISLSKIKLVLPACYSSDFAENLRSELLRYTKELPMIIATATKRMPSYTGFWRNVYYLVGSGKDKLTVGDLVNKVVKLGKIPTVRIFFPGENGMIIGKNKILQPVEDFLDTDRIMLAKMSSYYLPIVGVCGVFLSFGDNVFPKKDYRRIEKKLEGMLNEKDDIGLSNFLYLCKEFINGRVDLKDIDTKAFPIVEAISNKDASAITEMLMDIVRSMPFNLSVRKEMLQKEIESVLREDDLGKRIVFVGYIFSRLQILPEFASDETLKDELWYFYARVMDTLLLDGWLLDDIRDFKVNFDFVLPHKKEDVGGIIFYRI